MNIQRCVIWASLLFAASATAAAQDQTIIVDQPLQLCGTPQQFALHSFDEADAVDVIKMALGSSAPDASTYYVIHATEFVPSRMIVAAEHWYVYHQPWQQRGTFWWFRDSRQLKRFREARIMGSSRVALVYLYVNVPTYASRTALDELTKFFLDRRQREQQEEDQTAEKSLAAGLTDAQRQAALEAKRMQRLQELRVGMQDELPPAAEAEAVKRAGSSATTLDLIAALEAERYLKALAEQQSTFTSEFELVNNDNGEPLVGLSPTLATTAAYKSLANLFYRIDVTKKLPAPVQNLQAAAKFAFGGQSAAARRLGVPVVQSSVCAGRPTPVDHVPSDMLVKALVPDGDKAPTERSTQLFDNEGKYWWDVSFGLPLDLRRDLTVDVDAGQVAAKDVERGDLFVLANLGMPRDTKKIQWQLIPTFVYGIPITGKPLKHHLVGFTIGLNYVQLLGGVRFDRNTEVSTTIDNGTPVGVESAPADGKWEHEWVWGINLPVNTVVKMFKK
ncbi:MAG TPA: hypothetical protein VFJ02_07775 [Vicinamibacterales bacterium]|nr:hypothetical protein [Vicinamibacterales bacterium]